MTTLTNSLNEQLLTELTPKEAAVIEGGAYFNSTVNFDSYLPSRTFNVKPGGNIFLYASTKNDPSSANNSIYSVRVFNTKTGASTKKKYLKVGGDSESWRGMRGGSYKLIFEDDKDSVFVKGPISVSYDS
jgi:hypothetical protein